MSADIVLTEDTLRYISLFESLTKTNVIDCMETEDKLVYVVEKNQGNTAVGKKGEHVIKLKDLTGKNIQVVEFSDDPAQFVKNVFHIYNPQKVEIEQRGNITHATVTVDPKLKGRAIGKAGKKRHMGIRPTVRGSVMNPCDHPHGGGEGKSPIGRPSPVTPWGKPALGYKTRKKKNTTDKFIVKRRNSK